jgi:hypothetical protein
MRLMLALGAAVVATTMVADAHTSGGRHFTFHRGGEHQSADANGDGWLTRDEAGAHADRMFADLDRDNNGRLDEADHQALRREIEAHVDRSMERVRIDLEGVDEEIERHMSHLDDENCTRSVENVDGGRRVTVICENDDETSERRTDRRERMRHGPSDRLFVAPIPPIPPVPPVPMLAMWDDEESDLNGDGWLSREEFRAQQLRHFDARDANGDGRVRHEPPPEPPTPPAPPAPPSPPGRR